MVFFLYFISLIFLFINIGIIVIDYREKRIPNTLLLSLILLIPVAYGAYSLVDYGELQLWTLVLQFLLALGISFLLYYYGVWSAGDAKYLLVLSWYIPSFGIVPFIGNLSLIIIVYLIGYYLYFYARLFFRQSLYKNSFWRSIIQDKKEQWILFWVQSHKQQDWYIRFFRFILLFLVFFVSMRLLRSYLFEEIKGIAFLYNWFLLYPTYSFLGIAAGLFLIFYIFRAWTLYINEHLTKRFWWKRIYSYIQNIFPILLFFLLFSFIFMEYQINPIDIRHKLFLIFTVYLFLYFIAKILRYSYLVTFQLSEQNLVPISQLQVGDIVDKKFLLQLFWTQSALWYKKETWLLAPNPAEYISNMGNPIDKDTFLLIRNMYTIVNAYQRKRIKDFIEITTIKVLNTFAFGGYIFLAFLVTFFFGESPLHYVMKEVARLFSIFQAS